MISELVEDKNPVDKKGFTPLFVACHNGHIEICRYIDVRKYISFKKILATGVYILKAFGFSTIEYKLKIPFKFNILK